METLTTVAWWALALSTLAFTVGQAVVWSGLAWLFLHAMEEDMRRGLVVGLSVLLLAGCATSPRRPGEKTFADFVSESLDRLSRIPPPPKDGTVECQTERSGFDGYRTVCRER